MRRRGGGARLKLRSRCQQRSSGSYPAPRQFSSKQASISLLLASFLKPAVCLLLLTTKACRRMRETRRLKCSRGAFQGLAAEAFVIFPVCPPPLEVGSPLCMESTL